MKAYLLIVSSALTRLLRRRRVLGLLVLTGAPAPILFLLAWGQPDLEVFEMYQGLTLTLAMILVYPIATIVISTAALGEERKGHTMPFLVLKPVSRPLIAAAVTSAAAIACFVVLGIGATGTWLVMAFYIGEWSLIWSVLAALAIQSIASAALFVPVGLLISRATLVGLAYLFIWETILTSVVAGFSASSTFRITISAYADLTQLSPEAFDAVDELLGNVVVGAGGALAKVAVLFAASVVFTGSVLRSRDLAEE